MFATAAILLSVLTAQAPAPPAVLTPQGEPATAWLCSVQRKVAGAPFSASAVLDLDGHVRQFDTFWERRDSRPDSRVYLAWNGATFEAMAASARILFTIASPFPGHAELRRGGSAAAAPPLAAGAAQERDIKDLNVPWRAIEAAAQAPGGLLLVARGRAGGVQAQRRYDAATFRAVTAALRDARAQLDTLIADYRQRCQPVVEEVIVT